ncbi:S1C family serine protease [Limnochorda pilosa]|uniref:PDZ domain-containing protein n=1 Tax=Limnochorda pilosa TaxID=1555112 RepID=A0A0K2SQ81_LIMPI|nr:trypsin-like peptidase domain-containing protein [Limnochorda pilosa]BAS28994.1 hypothetical protein LIP_3167 [Limnochorda pilosa]
MERRNGRIGILVLAVGILALGVAFASGGPQPGPGPGAGLPRGLATGAGNDGASVVTAIRRVGPSVVKVSTEVAGGPAGLFTQAPGFRLQGQGSGIVIDDRGHILTNQHVVEGARSITVQLPDGRSYRAHLLGQDPWADLAVLQAEGKDLPRAPIGNSDRLTVGEGVIAIGNPVGFDYSVTAGIISALGRDVEIDPARHLFLESMIQTDAAINPGNSGGPLVDLDGKVVGMTTAVVRQLEGVTAEGLGFAVPINQALHLAGQIIEHGKTLRLGVLGGSLTPEVRKLIEEETGQKLAVDRGAYVTQVAPGSPAERAGMQAGDVVVAADGRSVKRMEDLRQAVVGAGFGGRLRVELLRGTERLQVEVHLE